MGNEASATGSPHIQSRVLEQGKRGGGRRGRRRNQICTTILHENVDSVNTLGNKLVESLNTKKTFSNFDQFVASLNESSQNFGDQFVASINASSQTIEKGFTSFFSSVMEDMNEIKTGAFDIGIGKNSPTTASPQVSTRPEEPKVVEDPFKGLECFETVRVLGKGKGTKVKLVKNKINNCYYAVKRQKYNFDDRKQLEHIYNEGKILPELDHPFVIHTHRAFEKGQYKKYFCMDFVRGGDLWKRLDAIDGPIPECEAIFYIAELILAIEYIHQRSIAYRDIKLENIMIDQEGHVKLIDFGFAKKMKDGERTYTICGTPDYMAPEIITLATVTNEEEAVGYDRMVDWWAIGVLFYELIVGVPPFPEDFEDKLKAIATCKYSVPKKISAEAKDFISLLLVLDPTQRLGFSGTAEVKQHKVFQHINWEKLFKKQIEPPFLPPVKPLDDKEPECSEGSYSM